MQTFLPHPDFQLSASCLDPKRLGKQRVEAKQILSTLVNGGGWQHHPAVKMWRGYNFSLMSYYNAILDEWVGRGYRNTMPRMHLDEYALKSLRHPTWLGNKDFHASHRSNLLRKNPDYYSRFGWTDPADLPYVWPNP